MVSYVPEEYWPSRYQSQGPAYVAKGGREASSRDQMRALTVHFRHLPSGGRVLDFGCGPERFRKPLEARGLTYEGVDLIPDLGTLEVADIEPESFDCAVAVFVLQHIVDEDAYREAVDLLHDALVPDGRLLVVDAEPMPEMDEHMHPRGPGGLLRWPWDSFRQVGEYDGHWIGLFRK